MTNNDSVVDRINQHIKDQYDIRPDDAKTLWEVNAAHGETPRTLRLHRIEAKLDFLLEILYDQQNTKVQKDH